jgi:KaiC/GvpD/RAD55 family RecA-like ATPase
MGRGESTGYANVDDLFTIAEGQLSVVTGHPSSGKSEFVTN